MGYDFQLIRDRHPLPEYLMARGIQLRQSCGRWVGKCPLHGERHGEAFSIKGNRWRCFGKCQDQGDIVDLVEKLDGISCREALERLGATIVDYTPVRHCQKPEPIAMSELTKSQRRIKVLAASRLYHDSTLQRRLADHRGWKSETIKALTIEHSLGWVDKWTFSDEKPTYSMQQGRLVGRGGKEGKRGVYSKKNLIVFGYEHGVKIRYAHKGHPLDGGANRRIQWLFGKATLWRSHLHGLERMSSVIITEGETDAIRWLDLGQCQKSGNLVIAAPSASTFKPEWAKLLQGKKVIVATDFDEAGQTAARTIAAAVHPYAKSVTIRTHQQ